MNLECLWNHFKEITLTTQKGVCGTKAMSKTKSQTRWWNENIEKQIKLKKEELFQGEDREFYVEYKQQRIRVKDMVQQAKKIM